MYLLLLAFGWLLGAAGIVLALSGMSLRDGTFDAAILTPGIVAVVGGFLLIALGAGLRILQRIERALASRSMLPALAIEETGTAGESAAGTRDPARILLAPKVSPEPQPAGASNQIFGAKPPESVSDPKVVATPVIASEAVPDADAELHAQNSSKNGNGSAAVRRLRLPTRLRPANAGERRSEPALEALWPKGPRPAVQAQDAAASNVPPSNPANVAAGVAVLKSGVVNGMPYTLYSDGSIEAQLAEGTLRFGSITELRNHIEQSA
jgi:hypothetical protein